MHLSLRPARIFLPIVTLAAAACSAPTPSPAPQVLADSFFSGSAFLDTNGNGQIDPADEPLKDARFIVHLQDGTEFGALTDETGNAFVTIPAAVSYPVTLLMKPPEDGTLRLIGPVKIILEAATGEKAGFLFAAQ